jgi:quinol monooxygenase YgiN
MRYIYLLEIKAKPGTVDELDAYVAGLLREAGSADGLDAIDAYHDLDEPETIVVVEQWATVEAHDRYALGKDAKVDNLSQRLANPPVLRRLGPFR